MWLAVNRANCVKRLVLWGVPVLTPELARQFKDEPAPVFDDDGEKIAAAWKGTRQAMPSLSTDQALTVLIGRLRMKEDAVWMHHALAETDFEELATQARPSVLPPTHFRMRLSRRSSVMHVALRPSRNSLCQSWSSQLLHLLCKILRWELGACDLTCDSLPETDDLHFRSLSIGAQILTGESFEVATQHPFHAGATTGSLPSERQGDTRPKYPQMCVSVPQCHLYGHPRGSHLCCKFAPARVRPSNHPISGLISLTQWALFS